MANTQGKRKINFLDFLLIILIIATVSAAIVSVIRSNPNRISGGDTEITYKIKCQIINANAAQKIKKGDLIYDNVTNQMLGTVISDPQIEPIITPFDHDTGKVTLTIEIKAAVWKNNGIYSVDNYRISEGIDISFHSEEFSYTGQCVSVAEVAEEANEQQ